MYFLVCARINFIQILSWRLRSIGRLFNWFGKTILVRAQGVIGDGGIVPLS